MNQPIRRENDDVMETKKRPNDVIKGIKGLVTVLILIPLPALEEATSTSHGVSK